MAASFTAQRRLLNLSPALAVIATGSAAIAYASTNRRTLQLEGKSDEHSKLPIYSSPPEPVILAEVRGPLEDQVASARKAVLGATHEVREGIQGQVRRWIGVEHAVENRISSLIPNDEPMTPGILYVGITTLSALVFGRHRGITLRLLAPPIALVGSLNYFLPKTAHNVGRYYTDLEKEYLPPFVGEQRRNILHAWHKTQHAAEEQYSKAREGTGQMIQSTLKNVEQGTGLKVGGSSSAPNPEARERLV